MKHFLHKINSIRLLTMLAVLVGVSNAAWAQSDKSAVYTSNVTLSTTGGTSASTAKVKISNTDYDAIKAGANKTAGAVKITVPSGTKYLHLHLVAWNGETVNVSISPNGNLSASYLSLTADAGVSGSGTTYTLSTPTNATTNYYKVLTFTNALTKDTEITFTAGANSTGGKRFVVWGVNSEEEVVVSPLSSIALSGTTYPTTFHQGDAFSHEGMTVTATYANGTTKDVSASATFSGYDMNEKGEQEVTVSYTENEVTKTATYKITVNAPATLSSIALSGEYPTTFQQNATFSSDGVIVTATYDDGTSKAVTDNVTFTGYDLSTPGNQTVTVTYTENEVAKTATYSITVTEFVQPTSFDITLNNTAFGVSTGNNATEQTLKEKNVTVVAGCTSSASSKTYYDTGHVRFYADSYLQLTAPTGYNITKIVFTANGTWNGSISVDNGTYDNNSKTWSGEANSLKFSFAAQNRISQMAITLTKQKALSSIAVSGTYPTTFEVGDEFSHEGVVVTATYDDSSNAVVTDKASFSTPDMTTAGTKTITVSYTENAVEKTTTYDITVKAAAEVESIALSGTYATTFNVGDAFSYEGMTVTASYDDDTTADVTSQAAFSGFDMNTAGTQTVTVSYTHKTGTTKTATYEITVNTVAVASVAVAPTAATVKIGKSVTLTSTVSPENATDKSVTWESSDTDIAKVSTDGVVTGVAAGVATITVKSVADATKSATCTVTVITAGDGSKANPYDVEEANEIISGYSKNSGSETSVYTKGIVSSVGSMYSSTMLNYYISVDGTSTNALQVFRGKNLGNTNFSATTDLQVGDEVVIYGQLYKYNSTYEINTGNYLYSLNGKKVPEITFGQEAYEVAYDGSLTITATADGSGAITYASSDATIAEINAETGVVTPHKSGIVTITANIAESSDNIAGSKTVELTVTDGRVKADIEFANAAITTTWGETFTGQDLTNPNEVTVAYTSSNTAVATVDASTGVVEVLKAGTTTITASFDGDEEYMDAEVTYTLTVNKAAAGLSFDETAFDVVLNDESLVAPTLNNPNELTVTYASDDENIAVVDETTGELLLDASAEGTVTITASFAGNDWFNAGDASYTITITDLNRKGTKTNPYTVAEVINGTATGSGIYVKGFIVGEFVGKSTNPRTSAFTTDANIAIADEYTSSPTYSASIPVALPTDALKTAWGSKTNSGSQLGYEVLLKGNKDTYFSVNGIKNTSEVSAVSVPVTVGAAGYTTITTGYAVSFEGTDVEAYKVTTVNPTSIHLEEVTEAPEGTALVIKADEGKHTGIAVLASASAIDDNLLLSSTGVTSDGNQWALAQINEVVGFYKVSSGVEIPKGKAYLTISSGSVKEFLNFDFEGGITTGINAVDSSNLIESNATIFNLAGQRMNRVQRGVNIVNGKKMLVK